MKTQESLPFAEWTYGIPEGEIRRLLKYKVKYYFGGGLPGSLPTGELATIVQQLGQQLLQDVRESGGSWVNQMFNYAKTPGSDNLRKLLLHHLVKRQHLQFDPEKDFDRMLITSGSQQSIYLMLDVMVNPGDYLLSAAPSYLGFVTPAVKVGGKVVLCPSDENGLLVDGVAKAIQAVKRHAGHSPKLLYVVCESDNPKGTTLPPARRKALFEIARKEKMIILEDAAYKEIQFGKERFDPIKAYDKDNAVVAYLGSTSKEAGVLRLGYALFPGEIRDLAEKAKGYFDICAPTITQKIAEMYYSLDFDSIVKNLLGTYRERCGVMIEAVESYFPEGIMTHPTGGFFLWWETLPGVAFDSKQFNEEVAIPNDVLFVPSHAFYPLEGLIVNDQGKLVPFKPQRNGMRLSFSAVSKELIREGIERLGMLLKNHLAQH